LSTYNYQTYEDTRYM